VRDLRPHDHQRTPRGRLSLYEIARAARAHSACSGGVVGCPRSKLREARGYHPACLSNSVSALVGRTDAPFFVRAVLTEKS
jgi:hypothetical protein